MPMLADQRKKTKWVINPTKRPLWTADSSGIKFGKELMEKMGWSAGKGLGVKEQGILEPLKVSFKNDTKGMGFKGNDDDWIEHQDEFNMFLSKLSNNYHISADASLEINKTKIKSLEDKSKESKTRMHYQKFTRGKDLSKYSENDLACITGIRKVKKQNCKFDELRKTEPKKNFTNECETSFGVTTINSGSIKDYFSKKWTSNDNKPSSLLKAINKADGNLSDSCSDVKLTFCINSEENRKPSVKEKNYKEMKDKSIENLNDSFKGKESDFPVLGNEERKSKKRKHNVEPSDTLEMKNLEMEKFYKEILEEKNLKKNKRKKVKGNCDEENKSKKIRKEHCKIGSVKDNETQISEVLQKPNLELNIEGKKLKKENRKSKSETEIIFPVTTQNHGQNIKSSLSSEIKSTKKSSDSKTLTSEIEETEEFDNQIGVINEAVKNFCKQKYKLDAVEKNPNLKKTRITFFDKNNFLNEIKRNNSHKKENGQSVCCEEYSCCTPEEYNLKSEINKEKSDKIKYKLTQKEINLEITESVSKLNESLNFGFITEQNLEVEGDGRKTKRKKLEFKAIPKFLENKNYKKSNADEAENFGKWKKEKRKQKKHKTDVDFIKDTTEIDISHCTNIDGKVCESSENQYISSSQKKEKRKKKPETLEEEFHESIDGTINKQKINLKFSEDILSRKYEKEIKRTQLNDLQVETLIHMNESEVFKENKSFKKKNKKEEENKWIENQNCSIKKKMGCAGESCELETKKFENRLDMALQYENAQNGPCAIQKKSINVNENKERESTNVKSQEHIEICCVKEKPFNDPYKTKTYTAEKVLDLICWADIKEFRGSNLGSVLGYGFKKEYQNTVQ